MRYKILTRKDNLKVSTFFQVAAFSAKEPTTWALQPDLLPQECYFLRTLYSQQTLMAVTNLQHTQEKHQNRKKSCGFSYSPKLSFLRKDTPQRYLTIKYVSYYWTQLCVFTVGDRDFTNRKLLKSIVIFENNYKYLN